MCRYEVGLLLCDTMLDVEHQAAKLDCIRLDTGSQWSRFGISDACDRGDAPHV